LLLDKKNSIFSRMAESTAWRDEMYERVLREETRVLERRFKADASCSIGDIENQLRYLYARDGNDQEGRGAVGDITLAATIAAFERFICARKTERSQSK
jgi:hypothetical protein